MATNGNTTTSKAVDMITRKNDQRNESLKLVEEKKAMLESLSGAKLPDDNPVIIGFKRDIEDAQTKADRLAEEIESLKKVEATRGLIQPLIEAFGEVEVKNAANITGTVSLVDLDSQINKTTDAQHKAEDRLTFLKALKAATGKVKIADEVIADMRPIKPTAKSAKRLIIEVSTGGGGGGPRAASPAVKITGCKIDDYVGKTVRGPDPDFGTWTALCTDLRKNGHISDEDYVAWGRTQEGKDRSYSMRDKLVDVFELELEEITAS